MKRMTATEAMMMKEEVEKMVDNQSKLDRIEGMLRFMLIKTYIGPVERERRGLKLPDINDIIGG